MYAVIRGDLAMSPGKMASQSCHAILGAFIQNQDPSILADYHKEFPSKPGTKVVLKGNLGAIERVREELARLGLPHFLVVDSGCQNFYEGKPIVTALGFGPARKHQLPKFIQRLNLL